MDGSGTDQRPDRQGLNVTEKLIQFKKRLTTQVK